MRTKGMFMLDLLSNAVGATLILLFLFIAMTGAEPPRGNRPRGGPPRQAALFVEVRHNDALARVDMVLLPPASARLAAEPPILGPPAGAASPAYSRAFFVPRLAPGCWRLALETVSDPRGLAAPLVPLEVTFWLSGLRPLEVQAGFPQDTAASITFRWPKDPPLEAPTDLFARQLTLDPHSRSTFDFLFLEEGKDLPADGGCAALPQGSLSHGGPHE